MISSRNGSAAPVAVVSGRARAAARETMPRIPVQATRKMCDQGGMGSRALRLGLRARGTQAAIGTQTRRTAMAVALTTAPCQSRLQSSSAGIDCRSVASWRPMRMKMTPFSRKIRRSHTARAWMRVTGATMALKCWRR